MGNMLRHDTSKQRDGQANMGQRYSIPMKKGNRYSDAADDPDRGR
jgi:hypothetical protein